MKMLAVVQVMRICTAREREDSLGELGQRIKLRTCCVLIKVIVTKISVVK